MTDMKRKENNFESETQEVLQHFKYLAEKKDNGSQEPYHSQKAFKLFLFNNSRQKLLHKLIVCAYVYIYIYLYKTKM